MPRIEHLDESRTVIAAGGLRLAFAWVEDRWVHEIDHAGPGDPRPLARSFETPGDLFEPSRVISPAFQQINFQEAGPTKVQALLVGQAGPHHFSAVFEVGEQADGVSIRVDVADRCRRPVEFLASTYRVQANSGDLSSGGPTELRWDLGPGRLGFAASPPIQIAFEEDGRRGIRVQAVATPTATPSPAGSTTHRWTYLWQWWPDLRRSPPPDPSL